MFGYTRKWRSGICKDCVSEYNKKYERKNRERLATYRKNWYEKNKERCLKKCAEWAAKNKKKTQKYKKRYIMNHKDRHRSSKLKCKYGITLEEYNQMLKKQNGVCAICKQSETIQNQYKCCNLVVDHDHETKTVRKLLCRRCNSVLGLVGENLEIILAMANYLKEYSDGGTHFGIKHIRLSA